MKKSLMNEHSGGKDRRIPNMASRHTIQDSSSQSPLISNESPPRFGHGDTFELSPDGPFSLEM